MKGKKRANKPTQKGKGKTHTHSSQIIVFSSKGVFVSSCILAVSELCSGSCLAESHFFTQEIKGGITKLEVGGVGVGEGEGGGGGGVGKTAVSKLHQDHQNDGHVQTAMLTRKWTATSWVGEVETGLVIKSISPTR